MDRRETTVGVGRERMSKLVLASGSAIRRRLLEEAGLAIDALPVPLDEDALRETLDAQGMNARGLALELARAKARLLFELRSMPDGAYVLAADQILELDGQIFAKPANIEQARHHLTILRGRTHALHTAVTLYRDGAELWSHVETPRVSVRRFSDAFLERYLEEEGEAILSCVGCYRVEGWGIQLMDAIDGAFDAVLGLPRIAVLEALRQYGVLES